MKFVAATYKIIYITNLHKPVFIFCLAQHF